MDGSFFFLVKVLPNLIVTDGTFYKITFNCTVFVRIVQVGWRQGIQSSIAVSSRYVILYCTVGCSLDKSMPVSVTL